MGFAHDEAGSPHGEEDTTLEFSIMLEDMGKLVVVMGIILVIIGLAFTLIDKLNLPSNPFDFHFKWRGIDVYFPLGTSLLISLALTLLLNLVFLMIWLMRR